MGNDLFSKLFLKFLTFILLKTTFQLKAHHANKALLQMVKIYFQPVITRTSNARNCGISGSPLRKPGPADHCTQDISYRQQPYRQV
jgi:hypothetical protein